MPDQPTTQPARDGNPSSRQPPVMDLALILEQLQEQIDQLLATVEAQQATIDRHSARIAALERR